ncbi:YcfL family protein [Vibrio sp. 10N.261.51.F12]|uniref:YcfL family protein n=1 Tax=Vibrio sp. 10N.261.51.F12 TaxID=3229679 RepID=UPI00354FF5F8
MKKWLLSIGVLLVLVGCSSNNTSGIKIEGQTQAVLYGDESMGNKFSIDDISTIDTNGHARGIVKLANKTSVDQIIQYRFYWYDEQGLEVNTKQAPWKRAILRGDETVTLSEVSVNPNGKEFRVQLRGADE